MKKILALTLLPISLFLTTPAQATTDGQLCMSVNRDWNTKFKCPKIATQKTVDELYAMGYKVVASYTRADGYGVNIIIEKQ